ncbi:MAG: M28 family peptidase [Bacteroidales bacterium]|jgi:hypothetical protein|nr:M28 family peptidase [Bacteroidales bacterium]
MKKYRSISIFLLSKNLLLVLLLMVIFVHSHARDSLVIRQIIQDLSAPCMHGRSISHKGDSIAANYIARFFEKYHVRPLGEQYLQPYTFPAFAMSDSVHVVARGHVLDPFHDFRIAPFSRSCNIQGAKILHVSGKIWTTPKLREKWINKHEKILPESFIFLDFTSSFFKKHPNKAQQAQVEMQQWKRQATFPLSHSPFGIVIGTRQWSVFGLSHTDFARDYAMLEVNAKVMKGVRNLDIIFENQLQTHYTNNVIATVSGTCFRDSFLVFTAHYDHLGRMGKLYFPGAHDNASGTATVLALAAYYQQHPSPYSMIFCLFSGEEAGLRGSKYFVQNSPIPLSSIKLVINLDLFCGGDEGLVAVNSTSGITRDYIQRLQQTNQVQQAVPIIQQRPNAWNSDHAPFAEQNVPALFLYTAGGRHGAYHSPEDTSEACSLDRWQNLFALITSWINEITDSK